MLSISITACTSAAQMQGWQSSRFSVSDILSVEQRWSRAQAGTRPDRSLGMQFTCEAFEAPWRTAEEVPGYLVNAIYIQLEVGDTEASPVRDHDAPASRSTYIAAQHIV